MSLRFVQRLLRHQAEQCPTLDQCHSSLQETLDFRMKKNIVSFVAVTFIMIIVMQEPLSRKDGDSMEHNSECMYQT